MEPKEYIVTALIIDTHVHEYIANYISDSILVVAISEAEAEGLAFQHFNESGPELGTRSIKLRAEELNELRKYPIKAQ